MPGRESEEGSPRNARAPSLGPVGPTRFVRSPRKGGDPDAGIAGGERPHGRSQDRVGSLRAARLSGGGHVANAGEAMLREGRRVPLRARVTALEVVPVRRICLQKSVGGDGPMKRLSNVDWE